MSAKIAQTVNALLVEEYLSFIDAKEFPCIAAKAAMAKENIECLVAGNMACPKDDHAILDFLYNFVDDYRTSKDFYHSAAILFTGPQIHNELMFDTLLWQRLQALEILDAKNFGFDKRVDADPLSCKFSFSIKEEAFYVIGLHPKSSRLTRRFTSPALVFNPHAQFEKLKETAKYNVMKNTVRKRDAVFSGSINPMLQDFGEASEVFQYSGRKYDADWKCPLKITHAL